MRADSPQLLWASLLLAAILVSTGCVSLTSPPSGTMGLHYTPREAAGTALADGSGKELPHVLSAPPRSPLESEAPERLHRRRTARKAVTGTGSEVGGEVRRDAAKPARQSAIAAHLAVLGAIRDVSGSTRRISGEFSRLKADEWGLVGGGGAGIFVRYVEYGERQLRWIDAQLAAATRLATAASEVEDPDMQLALLRLAGPRLEAAMLGSLLLAVWVDFLHLADVALEQRCYSVERMFADMWRWQEMLEPAMTALSSREHGQVEAAARDVPPLVSHLTEEFAATVERMRVAAETLQKALVLKDAIETATMLSTMRFALPSVPSPAPALVGIGLAVGGDGVMMGTRVVVSAEWVEMMRHLVRAGVLSVPVVSAAVRIQAGQVMLAQAHGELPRGVREALGDGPEVGAMHETGKAGAGMAEPPRHHVLPKEFREWFEKRGFTGEMDIDEFCIKMERAHHEAIHGGGHWKLGRTWLGEWNRMIMKALLEAEAEAEAGRMLTRKAILNIVAKRMEDYYIPINFIPWRGP